MSFSDPLRFIVHPLREASTLYSSLNSSPHCACAACESSQLGMASKRAVTCAHELKLPFAFFKGVCADRTKLWHGIKHRRLPVIATSLLALQGAD